MHVNLQTLHHGAFILGAGILKATTKHQSIVVGPNKGEAGSRPGTKSWARNVPVSIALLRTSLRRSRSIFIAFEITNFGYRRRKICRERTISLMSGLAPIYTIYGLLPIISGPSAPTQARPVSRSDSWDHWLEARAEFNGYRRGSYREEDSTRDNRKHNKQNKKQNSVLDRYVLWRGWVVGTEWDNNNSLGGGDCCITLMTQ
jgi:hypothetical protein